MSDTDIISTSIKVTVACSPMVGARDFDLLGDRQSLADIVAEALARDAVTEQFWWHGNITVDGMPVDRENWHRVRPKSGKAVHMWIPPTGPGIISGIGLFFFQAGVPIVAGSVLPTLGALATSSFGLAVAGVVGSVGSQKLFGDLA